MPDPIHSAADAGKCTHFQPADLVALAVQQLEKNAVPKSEWEGRRFHWGGSIESPPFTGLVLECKHKAGDWIITRMDRRRDGVTSDEAGFWEVAGE